VESQRLDFNVHYSYVPALTHLIEREIGQPASPREDRWHSVWTVPEGGTYVFSLETRGGRAELTLDGTPATRHRSSFRRGNTNLRSSSGTAAAPGSAHGCPSAIHRTPPLRP